MTQQTLNSNAQILALTHMLKPGDWVFLHGDLGAGKTFLTQNICKHLGVEDVITSPTFSIMNVYNTPSQNLKILHLDLYRLKNPLEICGIGLEHEFDVKNSIAFFEWPSLNTRTISILF